ncbi:hypothetical protein [Wolbachia endosymbiont of Tetranychus urticae]|uniref:hypothetical protein n=1 Tax=Wolbachia endosymbiont of Tetranychus urticae TaxID=169184 RepID=UPI00397D489E
MPEITHSEIITIILLYQQSPCENFKAFYLHYLTLLYKQSFRSCLHTLGLLL